MGRSPESGIQPRSDAHPVFDLAEELESVVHLSPFRRLLEWANNLLLLEPIHGSNGTFNDLLQFTKGLLVIRMPFQL